jgi:hypothetical protein
LKGYKDICRRLLKTRGRAPARQDSSISDYWIQCKQVVGDERAKAVADQYNLLWYDETKGCNGVDPDNVDGYNDNGLSLA